MATGGQFSYVTYLYDDIQWTGDEFDGFVGFFRRFEVNVKLPGSRSDAVRNLVNTSNVEVDGMWMFRVDSSEILMPPGLP